MSFAPFWRAAVTNNWLIRLSLILHHKQSWNWNVLIWVFVVCFLFPPCPFLPANRPQSLCKTIWKRRPETHSNVHKGKEDNMTQVQVINKVGHLTGRQGSTKHTSKINVFASVPETAWAGESMCLGRPSVHSCEDTYCTIFFQLRSVCSLSVKDETIGFSGS